MKDLIITSRRLKREIYILSTCFIIAFLINIFSIIAFKTPWYEIFTQIGYVLVITLILYLLVAIVRVIAFLIKKMINKFTLIFLMFCISIFSVHAKQIKLLAIANSFSVDANEYEHYLYGLAEVNGDTMIIENMYIGGRSLEKRYNNAVNNPDKIPPIEVSEDSWRSIAPYFYPPKEYRYCFHGYRTPLQFYDCTPVKNRADWSKRREEIRSRWMEMMGKWPPILDQQEFEIIGKEKREDFIQYKVRFYWTPNEQTEGYLQVPDRKGKKPAVITVYYEPETAVGIGGKPYRDFAYQLVKRGFVTLSLGTSETTKNKTYSIYYPNRENATIQPLSALAYAAANALEALSKVEDVDPERIGIVGHSYGGKWAMFASCLYDKFACAAWGDPGIVFDETKSSNVNYWEPWYLGYYPPPWDRTWSKTGENAKGLYPKLRKEGYDLHELHALMAPRPFLVSGGSSDPVERWIPLNHTIAVNKLLGYTHRVAMTNRSEHSPNAESNKVLYAFFEWFLKPNE